MKVLVILSLLTLCAFATQDAMKSPDKLEQHEWLQQLVGEWAVNCEMVAAPESEVIRWDSTESIRSIGGLWVVAEGSFDNGGEPGTSLMTLGYDSNKDSFVGTWIDTMQTTLWAYYGELDESKRVLSLYAEGPDLSDPSKTAKYRDQIELIGPDEKKMTSSMFGDDGNWTPLMTMHGRRVK